MNIKYLFLCTSMFCTTLSLYGMETYSSWFSYATPKEKQLNELNRQIAFRTITDSSQVFHQLETIHKTNNPYGTGRFNFCSHDPNLLDAAVRGDNVELAKNFLLCGATPDIKTIHTQNIKAQTTLSRASSAEMIDILVGYGADLHHPSNPLINLAKTGYVKSLSHLLHKYKLNPNLADALGATSMHYAAENKDLNMMLILGIYGAEFSCENKLKETPLDYFNKAINIEQQAANILIHGGWTPGENDDQIKAILEKPALLDDYIRQERIKLIAHNDENKENFNVYNQITNSQLNNKKITF